MIKTASAIALLVAAGAAQAAFFEARSGDAGSLGSPISYTGTLYQNVAFGGNVGPNQNLIPVFPDLEFDSYVGVDVGPSTSTFTANGATPISFASAGGPFNNPGQISNLWFINGEAGSVPNAAFGGADAIFMGRFTFAGTAGGTLSLGANGFVVDIIDAGTTNVGSPATDSLLVRFNAFNTAVQSGLDGGSLTTHPTANAYELRLNSFVAQAGGQSFSVNDLYVVQIPTPGATALLGLAGVAAIRRRRA